jgi:lysophospholipase L1-like esterase
LRSKKSRANEFAIASNELMCGRFSPLTFANLAVCVALVFASAGCGGEDDANVTTQTWPYAAMGDSLAVGVLASRGYVPRYQQHVHDDTGANVVLTNLGVNGWTSSDLLLALRSDARFRAAVRTGQIVTWDIGGNDLRAVRNEFISGTCGGADNQECLRQAVAQFKTNWDAIVSEILSLRDPRSTILRTMDIYNPFVDLDRISNRFGVLNGYLNEVNAYITASAARNNILCAKVHEAFNGASGEEDPVAKGLISVDHLHPNDKGHEAIATAFRNLRYVPLR